MLGLLLALILEQDYRTVQTTRDLEIRLIEIQRELQQEDLEREQAVQKVNGHMDSMQTALESQILPPLTTVANELTTFNKNFELVWTTLERREKVSVVKEIGEAVEGWAVTIGIALFGLIKGGPAARKVLESRRKKAE